MSCIPNKMMESYTTLIPKRDNAIHPGDYRPITVSYVLTLTLNKVLARRVLNELHIDSRQKAVQPEDGCV